MYIYIYIHTYLKTMQTIFPVKPISTSIAHKPKQLVTESQITLSCEVEGSVPDTDIKWTQNNRVFERGTVSTFFYQFWVKIMKNFLFDFFFVHIYMELLRVIFIKFYSHHNEKFLSWKILLNWEKSLSNSFIKETDLIVGTWLEFVIIIDELKSMKVLSIS